MFSSISWSQYVSTLVILLACYYAYVAYKYYSWELLAIVGIKKVEPGTTTLTTAEFKQQITAENHADYLSKDPGETDLSPVINSLEDEITAYLQESGNDATKLDILNSLKQICSKYPVLKNVDSRVVLDGFIHKAVKGNCAEEISINDIQQLWR
ncbi:MAG: hypothetical protein EKK37_04405 [Sphingobacteriales bacterium]|jgi:hypothetical protein|nr:MAG: hypothetical protein EKK37_04405 [Sphingobacteriales bacterium]